MYRKCDRCERKATHHSIEILGGQKIEKHLCDVHAAEEGLAIKPVQAPINALLTNFVKIHGVPDALQNAAPAGAAEAGRRCGVCGLAWAEFRSNSLLGCPACYQAFETSLEPLLERAHEGADHHIGKVPRRAGLNEQRQLQLARMRQRLEDAVESEDYELAARLRDDIRKIQAPESAL